MNRLSDVVRSGLTGRPADPRGAWVNGLVRRHRDQLVLGVCVYRMVAALVPLTEPANIGSPTTATGLVPLTVLVIGVNLVMAVLIPRHGMSGGRWTAGFLVADLSLSVMLNLAGAAIMPATALDPVDDTFWYALQGSVACVVALRGVRPGVVVVLASVPLCLVMAGIGAPAAGSSVAPKVLLMLLWLLLALACAIMIMNVAVVYADAALDEGLDAGADAEQLRLSRALHDTVLQTLEAIALQASLPTQDAAGARDRLAQIQRYARRQAQDLRRDMEERWPGERAPVPADRPRPPVRTEGG